MRAILVALLGSFMAASAMDPSILQYLYIGEAERAWQALAEEVDREDPDVVRARLLTSLQLGEIAHAQTLIRNGEHVDPQLCEELAWAYIRHGFEAPSLTTRLYAVAAAGLSQDSRGATLLLRALQDSNVRLRQLGIYFCSGYPDRRIQEALRTSLQDPRARYLRVPLIRACAAHSSPDTHDLLERMLFHSQVTPAERGEIVTALVAQEDTVSSERLQALVAHPSAACRLLACQLFANYGIESDAKWLYLLLSDPQSEIRVAAMEALVMRGVSLTAFPAELQADLDPAVRVVEAWARVLDGDQEALLFFRQSLLGKEGRQKQYAAMALSHSGRAGADLAAELIDQLTEPVLRAHLALAMIGEGVDRVKGADVILDVLRSSRFRWKRLHKGMTLTGFCSQSFHPSSAGMGDSVAEDLVVRLSMLDAVACVSPEKASVALREYLLAKQQVASGLATMYLLAHGDIGDTAVVRALLHDSEPAVRVQAAMLLALFARDNTVRGVLEEAYAESPRELKEAILEALGALHDRASLPFLVQVLDEPFESLRIIAASSIIRVLNG